MSSVKVHLTMRMRAELQENIFHGQAPGLWPLKMDKP